MSWDSASPEPTEPEYETRARRPGLHAAPPPARPAGADDLPHSPSGGQAEVAAPLPASIEALPELEPSELGALFARGEPAALAEAYRRHSPLVFTLAVRTLGNSADAEDVTQRVFIQAWRSRERFDPARRPLPAWLVGMTRHAIADRLSERSRDQGPQERVAGRPAPSADDGAIAERVADAVMVADGLAQLPQPRRRVLELSFFDGLTHTQIAEALELPLETVKSHIKGGLAQLKTHVEVSDEPS